MNIYGRFFFKMFYDRLFSFHSCALAVTLFFNLKLVLVHVYNNSFST